MIDVVVVIADRIHCGAVNCATALQFPVVWNAKTFWAEEYEMTDEQLIRHLYDLFNHRDIDAVLSSLAEDVIWANGMEGTYVHGRQAVREYWTYQWSVIDPSVSPMKISATEDGALEVEVHQTVRDLQGVTLLDEFIRHVFRVENERVTRFDIKGSSHLADIAHG